jgi:DNA polymerase-3 subunit epsilon
MHKDIDEMEFVVFDTETTGLDPQAGDRIVEIACLKFRAGEKLGSLQTLVNPGREISPAAFNVNRITPQMLAGAPAIGEVMPGLLDFISGSCLCSYNAAFDLGFLDKELKLLGLPALEDNVVVDVLKMARRLLPGEPRYALWAIACRLGIQESQQHRALADVELTWQVFSRLKEMLKGKGVGDFADFSRLFAVKAKFLEDIRQQHLAQIEEAIGLGARLKIKYLSSSGAQVSQRDVQPKEVRRVNNRDYLVGYCFLRRDERTFSLDGILHLEIV